MESSAKVLCLCAFVGLISGSAIPMWEYLSKQEKMSYLYSMFANQVDDFCEKANMKNCNHELLKYGLDKLKDMPEDHLDTMDPYQRGAHDIIWDSMMAGHAMASTTQKPQNIVTTTAKPNSYDDQSFDEEFGNQGEGSARIDTIYRVPPPKGFVFKIETGKPLYTYPHNFQYIPRVTKNSIVQQYVPTTSRTPGRFIDTPLTGPMEVKVYPDGTPVQGSRRELPQDEDLRQYHLSKQCYAVIVSLFVNAMEPYGDTDLFLKLGEKFIATNWAVVPFLTIILIVAVDEVIFNEQCYAVTVSLFVNAMEPYDIPDLSLKFVEKLLATNWVVVPFLSIILIVAVDEVIFNEGKRVAENIQIIQHNVRQERIPYKSMELFLLNTKINDRKFSVAGCFYLDWNLIYCIVSGVSTYLVYLIQFREMELQKGTND
ncbi:hypothetical protein WA026_002537 [Henosepilachna vigintioctopunctata]|uniref:Gustatory receptor n=1 Tax=Henosepilachna vigintioctopunctata TaxID=420089 RepID=A0AAW1U4A5_9CUCU